MEKKEVVKKTTKAAAEKKVKASKYKEAYRLLVKPLVTEKAANAGVINKYIFTVSNDANKIEISKAIKEVYGVKPADVNVINVKGKKVRFGRTMGKRKDTRKAIVTLAKGESINIYEGV